MTDEKSECAQPPPHDRAVDRKKPIPVQLKRLVRGKPNGSRPLPGARRVQGRTEKVSSAIRPRSGVADLSETQAAVRDSSWGPAGPKPIEPDTSIGGIVAAVRPLKTKKGDRMAVFTLEDAQGSVEIIAFPEAYQRAAGMIEPGTLVLVRGKLERDDETSRILASEIAPIESVREKLAREVAIHLRKPADRGTLEALVAIFSRHRGDRKVSFDVETGEAPNRLRVKVDLSSQIRVRPSPALIQDIEQVVGEGAVELR